MENPIIRELTETARLGVWDKQQQDFFDTMAKRAVDVKCVPLAEVFTPAEIDAIKSVVRPKRGQCYRNAALLAECMPDRCRYVEGFGWSGFFKVDHAFNRVGDKYVDITWELVLKQDITKLSYVSLIEASADEVVDDITSHNNITGDYFRRWYVEKHMKRASKGPSQPVLER